MASGGSVYVDLLLRDSSYVTGWNRARNTTKTGASQIQGDMGRIKQSFEGVVNPINNIGSAVRQLAAITAGAFSVQQLIRYNDVWTQLEGRLSLVTGGMGELVTVQNQLFEIAQRTRQPLEGVYNLYTRLAQAIPEAQRSQYDLLGVTESINQALAITGEGSAQASSAILQFTQAVASGFKGSGQEINALLDSAPRLARALQSAFGDGQKSLKELSQEGALDLDIILKALAGTGEEGRKLREEFAKIPPTVGQAFTQLSNAFLQFIGQSAAVESGTSTLVIAIQVLANNLGLVTNAAIALSSVLVGRFTVAFFAKNFEGIGTLIHFLGLRIVAAHTATTLFSTTLKGLGLIIGGPINAAIIALAGGFLYLSQQQSAAEEISSKYPETFQRISEESKTAVVNIDAFNKSLNVKAVSDYNNELKNLKSLMAQLNDELKTGSAGGFFDVGIGGLVEQFKRFGSDFSKELHEIRKAFAEGKIDIDQYALAIEILASKYPDFPKTTQDIRDQISALRTGAEELSRLTSSVYGPPLPAGWVSPRETPKSEETDKPNKSTGTKRNEQEEFLKKHRELLTGLNADTLKYMDTEKELYEARRKHWIDDNELSTALQRLNEDFVSSEETVNEWGINVEEFSKKAAGNIQDAFADFLFDPFKDGTQGMLKNFVDVLRRMMAEAAASRLSDALFGAGDKKGSGGLLSGLFGGLLGGGSGGAVKAVSGPLAGQMVLPTFADGGYLGPGQWGVAGEAGAELLYGGKTGVSVFNQDQMGRGGNIYNIDATGADKGAVVRLEQALLTLAGPGVIEKRVGQAQVRGEL